MGKKGSELTLSHKPQIIPSCLLHTPSRGRRKRVAHQDGPGVLSYNKEGREQSRSTLWGKFEKLDEGGGF